MAQQGSVTAGAPYRGFSYLFLFGVVILLMAGVIVVSFNTYIPPVWMWLIQLALLVVLMLVISRAYTHRWLGILIDERNKYSLSRLQMALWTIIILSAFITAVLANVQLLQIVTFTGAVDPPQVLFVPVGRIMIDALAQVGIYNPDDSTVRPDVDVSQLNLAQTLHDGEVIYIPLKGETPPQPLILNGGGAEGQPTTPLSVQIPSEVWLLLGISTTSLVASPLIKGQKQTRIVMNESATEAKLSDLFRGEEAGNFMQLDLAKVQLFYFTVIVIGAYAIALASMFISSENAITSLPALDGGVIAMLGVSHAGYLTNKAVPKDGGDGALPEAQPQTAGPNPPGDSGSSPLAPGAEESEGGVG